MDEFEDMPHRSPYDGFCMACKGFFKVGDGIERLPREERGQGRSDYRHTRCPSPSSRRKP